ncbi:MAG: glycosyltransferase family 4 protein [Colwellia sp.]|uniref:glycosyltransferase family 4 protein n=1 Tax=Alteromonadales TaxID=135622 RepID=UPI001D4B8080|nr:MULTISPECIES: glycosyltransferase family 4 protein [Alteromonadales]NQZ26981.1 glycosyltransferase family 4 protein [Colwellia sp.]NRA78638.1 glycosyltransferase family 4 protein [Pseudoalteromonas sp.]
MKILIVTQWFDPEPTFKGLLFAKELVKAGHEVEVITGFPNYPGGMVYDGYSIKFHSKEVIDGVIIHRVPLYPAHDSSAIKRIANYISFAASSCLCGLFSVSRPDVIYSYHPPLTTALSATLISLFRRAPLVVDIQDLWPDTLAATGMLNNKKALSLIEVFCQLVYKRASKVVVLSPGFKKRLQERGVPVSKLEVIYNWCDEEALEGGVESTLRLPNNGRLNLLFAGNLGNAQGLPSIIDAADILQSKQANINIVFLGAGIAKDKAVQQAKELALDNVYFLPRVPMQEVGGLLKKADILLVHLTDDELFSITIPSRTQAYLAIGKPIVMGVNGDASDLIKQAKAGVSCKANNSTSLANALITLVNKSAEERGVMGSNALNFYQSELAVAVGVKKFISVFEEVKR